MSTLKEREQTVIDTFGEYEDWMDRYQYLVDLGSELEPLPDEYKTEETLIRGCQSQVWLVCEEKNGLLYFRGDGDAVIVKGIVAMLISVVSGSSAKELAEFDFSFIDKIGLKEHLSPTRSNGLLSMVNRIKTYAQAANVK